MSTSQESTSILKTLNNNAVIIIITIAIIFVLYYFPNADWNDPSAPYFCGILLILLLSSLRLAQKYGFIIGLLALIWPCILLAPVMDYTGTNSLVPACFLFLAIIIFSMLV